MILLILLLPLIGSLFLVPIKEYSYINSSSIETAELFACNTDIHSDQLAQEFVTKKVRNNSIIKQIGLSTSLITLFLTIILFSQFNGNSNYYQFSPGDSDFNPAKSLLDINTSFSSYSLYNYDYINWPGGFAVDGLSIFFVLLTAFITPICLLSNWKDIIVHVKYFVFFFLLLESLQIAFFLATNLMLFYIFFESVLIPLFLIVGIWGASQARIRAAFLLFLYTLGGSLPMLLVILWIFYNVGSTDFNYLSLFIISPEAQSWIWIAFLLAFAVKSPVYPFHLWLFRAHAESPLGGSILLAAIILKLATYGFLRVLLGVLPEISASQGYIVHAIAIVTLIYSSLVTIRQIDLKGLVAYSSIAHMAICILGIFSNNIQGIEGAILLSLAHGLVSPALFIIVGGFLYSRYHTRVIHYYRGITLKMPILGLIFFLFIIFNASAPLSINFVGEFLALTGIFKQSPVLGALASTGIVLSAIYSIYLYNRVSFLSLSPYLNKEKAKVNSSLVLGDLTRFEVALILPLLFITVILGLFPNVILESLHYDVTKLIYNFY